MRIDVRRLDYVVAAATTVALQLETWLGGNAEGHRIPVAVLGPLVTLGVALRRRYPTAVGVSAAVNAVVLQAVWPQEVLSYAIAWMCAMYGLAVWASPRRFRLGLGIYLLSAAATLPFVDRASASVFFVVVSAIVMVLVHVVVGERDRRVRLAERERDVAAREAVVEERARIARELHDAIAHNVSMMVVQAGAERRVVEADGSTKEVLATIEQIGRGALTEMRRLVGMLRSDGSDPLEPQPGLRDLPTLVSQVADAGLPVELHVEGDPRTLPVGIELSAYRIVQEALTNALKHAGDACATVHVRYGLDSLELEIADDGGETREPVPSGGHGLVGMRERVALYGGSLQAGRRATGGFAVRVLLPTR